MQRENSNRTAKKSSSYPLQVYFSVSPSTSLYMQASTPPQLVTQTTSVEAWKGPGCWGRRFGATHHHWKVIGIQNEVAAYKICREKRGHRGRKKEAKRRKIKDQQAKRFEGKKWLNDNVKLVKMIEQRIWKQNNSQKLQCDTWLTSLSPKLCYDETHWKWRWKSNERDLHPSQSVSTDLPNIKVFLSSNDPRLFVLMLLLFYISFSVLLRYPHYHFIWYIIVVISNCLFVTTSFNTFSYYLYKLTTT